MREWGRRRVTPRAACVYDAGMYTARTMLLICLSGAAGPLAADVVINEIHYAPRERTELSEYIELYNAGGGSVDLSGWHFSDGIRFTFPASTTLAAGAYVLVAQDPDALESVYGALPVYGPWEGRLSNRGESIVLRSRDGQRQDEVDYGDSFPWPVVGGSSRPNRSIELIHPDLDNDLGASWRPSDPNLSDSNSLLRAGAIWRYRKGTSEASSPVTAWRQAGYDDSSWLVGRTSIGYGDGDDVTTLSDMQGSYTSVYLRHEFDIASAADIPDELTLRLYVDDGAIVWINGDEVARAHVGGGQIPFDGSASSHEASWEEIELPPPGEYLQVGENVIAIHALNTSEGSSDFSIDAALTMSSTGAGPTPAARNTIFAASTAPALRQVQHSPLQPVSGEPVTISVKATDDDGIASLSLDYQLVDPGSYIRISDPEYVTDWTTISMNDSGNDGDLVAGDTIWSATLPSNVQTHRRLVRYRIAATDGAGSSVTVPYSEDPQPNFAYWVYDGVPVWRGAARPGVTTRVNYPSDLLESLPIYQLLTRRQDHLNALSVPYRWGQADQQTPTTGSYGGSDYRWEGTLVYDGRVYDHIRYRARGGVWRYSMGKNMWKFDFNRGHSFEARDDFGRKYRSTWSKLNFSAIIQQRNFLQRGEQGLFEGVGFKLHNLAGNAAPKTHFIHFRTVEAADEDGPDQFSGDFQGLYLVIEQMDGRFLDEHDLPDGNLYKMEGGSGTLNNQGPTQPTNRSDLQAFQAGSNQESWWEDNLDLDNYYNFRAIMMAIHDYDVHAGKNYFYYHNPEDDRWQVLNWDLDLTWTTTYNGGGGRGPLNQQVLDAFPRFRMEYENRMRELRDLLFNVDQTGTIISEVADVVFDPGELSWVDADRAMWDYNPILASSYINNSKAGHGHFYEDAASRTFAGMGQNLFDYVADRGSWIDTNITRDTSIPRRPSISYTGPAGYPLDEISFRSSSFSDPQGSGTFAAMKWRVAEVSPSTGPAFDPEQPKIYEIDAVWESDELTSQVRDLDLPDDVLVAGRLYRARVRMQDSSGRWSRWSVEHEFTAGAATTPSVPEQFLRITEVHYNPPEGPDYEFIELRNTGPVTIDLSSVRFTAGIEFDFGSSAVTELGPGEFVVVVENAAVFASRYDTQGLHIAGEFRGRLGNAGDRIELRYGAGGIIHDFEYLDTWVPESDGLGSSMVIRDELGDVASWALGESWRPSHDFGGSPGFPDVESDSGFQLVGNLNQDTRIDISDAYAMLRYLFSGQPTTLPCGDGEAEHASNRFLLDVDGSESVDIGDPIYLLAFLFQNGPPPTAGTSCLPLLDCPFVCR